MKFARQPGFVRSLSYMAAALLAGALAGCGGGGGSPGTGTEQISGGAAAPVHSGLAETSKEAAGEGQNFDSGR